MPKARLPRFAVISGLGWLIDAGLTLGLVALGLAAGPANAVGATAAVTFVFFAAQRRVFIARGGPVMRLLLPYLAYQVVAIALASAAIGGLAAALAGPAHSAHGVLSAHLGAAVPSPEVLAAAVAKVLVTPLTMYANFLFMGRLVEGRAAWK